MADIICPKCLEPWDIDELHEVVGERVGPTEKLVDSFDGAYSIFKRQGCGTLFGNRSCSTPEDPQAASKAKIAAEVAELMGDDVDGYYSMMEDFDLLYE